MKDQDEVPTGCRLALTALLVLVVLSPWAFGSVHPVARWLITAACLVTVTGIALVRLRRGEGVEVPTVAMLGAGVFLLGLAQLVPLPPALHGFLAPGSAAIWHPQLPAAAQVLGEGPRPISIWPEATGRAVEFGLGVIALATLAMPALRDRHRAVRVASIVVGSALAVAVYGLVARLAFGDKLFGVLTVPTIAPFGPFVSKNHYAGYVEMTALLALGLAAGLADETRRTPGFLGWIGSERAPRVVLALGAAFILVLSVLVSLSRGGALGLTVGIATLLLLRSVGSDRARTRWPVRLLVVASALVFAFAAFLVLPPEARERLMSSTAGTRDPATAFRVQVWGDSLRLSARSPLVGHGLGTFVDALPSFKTGAGGVRIEHAENDYLEVLVEAGVTGLLLALGSALALGSRAWAGTEPEVSRLRRNVALGAASGLAALAAHSLVDFNLRIPSNGLLFALLAAVYLTTRRPSAASRISAGVLAGLGVVLLAHVSLPPPSGRVETLPAVQRVHSRAETAPLRLEQVTAELEQHLRQRPADAEAWVWLGWARAARGRTREGSALAAYGCSLDPQRRALREAAERLIR